jgi:hypothetical protein
LQIVTSLPAHRRTVAGITGDIGLPGLRVALSVGRGGYRTGL